MSAREFWIRATLAVVLLAAPAMLHAQLPAGTVFTYQGQLKDSGRCVDDTADFEFSLWQHATSTDPGDLIAGPLPVDDVDVVEGLFTVVLDFGNVFTGDARWLEIAVRSPAGGGAFTTLSPRQELTPVPYAQQIPGIFVADDGKVGIGTDSPSDCLNIQIGETASGGVTIGDPDNYVALLRDAAGDPERGVLQLFEEGTERIRLHAHPTNDSWIDPGGNMGIGTTSPSHPLSVHEDQDAETYLEVYNKHSGTASAAGLYLNGYGNNFSIKTWGDGTSKANLTEFWSTASGSELAFGTTDAERVRIDSAGYVGIGTASPDYKLDVNGNFGLYGHVYGTHENGLSVATTQGHLTLGPTTGRQVRVGWTGTHRDLYVSGDVGIGTTSPGYELDVSGDIRATGAIYGTVDNADKLDGQHASAFASSGHTHCGESWSCGYSTGLTLTGSPYGVDARGATAGGYFDDTNNSAYAYVAYGLIGIQAEGDFVGGSFEDGTTGTYGYVGYDTHSTYGNGYKSFVQNHPYAEDKVITYACLEGDEVATYTRGAGRLVDGVARVPLGETFKWVTNPDVGLTAYLTPCGDCRGLYVASLTTEELVVRELGGGTSAVAFDYIVYGLRIGFEEASVVREKEREAYIPSMASHRERYEEYPELRQYNALERFSAMRATVGETGPLDLSASQALRAAITEFDPRTHDLPGMRQPQPEDGNEPAVDMDADCGHTGWQPDPERGSAEAPSLYALSQEAAAVIQAQQDEISRLQARLQALEALVAELAAIEDGGAR